MNTVKHYKDLGLVFVAGDLDGIGNIDWLNDNRHAKNWAEQEINSFAWRKNTGEKPEFRGEVEVKHRTGEVSSDLESIFRWGISGTSGDIIAWRPLPIQPEPQEKPTYTQEMVDAKELVPVGADYRCGGGITKREHFAGLAMQGLLSSSKMGDSALHDSAAEWVVDITETSVEFADALLKELEK